MSDVRIVTVFADGPGGENPAPIVLDAAAMTDDQMQEVAKTTGHESAYVVDNTDNSCDLTLRFWVPNHEMDMCGHATIGAVWLLHQLNRLPKHRELRIHTNSGPVRACVDDSGFVTVSQPAARVETVADADADAVLDVLGLTPAQLAPRPVRNATTSRTKTLVPLRDVATLDTLKPDLDRVAEVCDRIQSTGLYPYASSGQRQFDARQFPRASGYPEDPATGIAAAALTFGLLTDDLIDRDERPVIIRQGRAMGRPSRITTRFITQDDQIVGCWLGGHVKHGSI